MAGKFTKIPKNTFDAMQFDAGVILRKFDPNNPVAPADADIVCATTGGITASCVPTYSDLGDDVDNCPINTKELKHLDGWDCKLGYTSIGTDAEGIRMALGAADIDGDTIVPRSKLEQEDFKDELWWVGDKPNGGFVAVKLMNALSTSGFSLQTTKNGKGQTSVEMTGHVSINDIDTVPMEFYSFDEASEGYSVKQLLNHITSSYTSTTVSADASFTATLTADTDYTIDDASVVVKLGGIDVTAMAYNSTTNTVTIAKATSDIYISASAVADAEG